MFCTRVAWVCSLFCKEGSSPVFFSISERRDMGLYEVVPLSISMSFCWMGQLPYLRYYVGVKSSFQHAREECKSKRGCVLGA